MTAPGRFVGIGAVFGVAFTINAFLKPLGGCWIVVHDLASLADGSDTEVLKNDLAMSKLCKGLKVLQLQHEDISFPRGCSKMTDRSKEQCQVT
jgi:hypothetical protein